MLLIIGSGIPMIILGLRTVRSRRFEVLWCFHFVDVTRIMLWVVSFSISRPFGPRRGRRVDGVVVDSGREAEVRVRRRQVQQGVVDQRRRRRGIDELRDDVVPTDVPVDDALV